jgi:hypothetical protein
LAKWADTDLGELDRFLSQAGSKELIGKEFIDVVEQCDSDLSFAEVVINDIWKVALDELATITETDLYHKDQAKGRDGNPPQHPEGVSAESAPGSGFV